MGENWTDLWLYTRRKEEIYDPGKFQQLVEGLAALNFYVALPAEVEDRSTLTTAGVSPRLQEVMQHAQSLTKSEWLIQAHSLDHSPPSDGFFFRIRNLDLDEEEEEQFSTLDIDYLTRLFDESTNGLAMYEHFLEAIRLIYEVYHPIYGYELDARDDREPTTKEEMLALQIHTLYDINLFGPELVEKLGRQRVESTQAEKVIPLDDGGIMLVPRIFFYSDFRRYDSQKIATHLGLSYPV